VRERVRLHIDFSPNYVHSRIIEKPIFQGISILELVRKLRRDESCITKVHLLNNLFSRPYRTPLTFLQSIQQTCGLQNFQGLIPSAFITVPANPYESKLFNKKIRANAY
jgi:hypothetical protein